MSRGSSFNDLYQGIQPISPWPEPGTYPIDEEDDFHQDGDEARLEKYSNIIKQIEPKYQTILIIEDAQISFPGKFSKWRRIWIWFFFNIRTEVTLNAVK